jgi:hypothetical protein
MDGTFRGIIYRGLNVWHIKTEVSYILLTATYVGQQYQTEVRLHFNNILISFGCQSKSSKIVGPIRALRKEKLGTRRNVTCYEYCLFSEYVL